MKIEFSLILTIAALSMAGCHLPKIEAPIGVDWERAEIAQLDGQWTSDNGERVSVTHHEGILYVPNQAFNKKIREFEVRTIEVVPRLVGKTRLLFVKGKGESDPYLFFHFEKHADDSVSIRQPSPEFFADAVSTSKVRGRVTTQSKGDTRIRSATLDCDLTELISLLESSDLAKVFPAETKISLHRAKGSNK